MPYQFSCDQNRNRRASINSATFHVSLPPPICHPCPPGITSRFVRKRPDRFVGWLLVVKICDVIGRVILVAESQKSVVVDQHGDRSGQTAHISYVHLLSDALSINWRHCGRRVDGFEDVGKPARRLAAVLARLSGTQSMARNEVEYVEARQFASRRLVPEWLCRDVTHRDTHAELDDPHRELQRPPGPRFGLERQQAVDDDHGVHLQAGVHDAEHGRRQGHLDGDAEHQLLARRLRHRSVDDGETDLR